MELPVMDGLTVLKHLRSNPKTQDLAVIICTALSDKELFIELFKLNISDYIMKTSGNKVIKQKLKKFFAVN